MVNLLKSEWLKEKRTVNKKLFLIIPIVFASYCLLMSFVMGGVSYGKDYLIVTAYNWYPLMILPLFISLLTCNSLSKERKHHNQLFYRTLDISTGKVYLSKLVIVTFELSIILLASFITLFALGKIMGDTTDYSQVFLASIYLFIGSLPLIPISMIIYQVSNYFVVILVNFVFNIFAAIPAVESWWGFWPWSYSLRLMAPTLGIHPNGTFLEAGSYLLDASVVPIALILGVGLYLVFSGILYFLGERRGENA